MGNKSVLKKMVLLLFVVMMTFALPACGNEAVGDENESEDNGHVPNGKVLDVAESLEITFDGYDGYGSVTLSNTDAWIDLMDSEVFESESDITALRGAVTYTLSKVSDLANGEEIVITIEANNELLEKYDYYVKKQTKSIKVEGLKELQEIDPFELMDIYVCGRAPYAYIDGRKTSFLWKEQWHEMSIVTEGQYGLKGGEVTTISLVSSDNTIDIYDCFGRRGYKPTRVTMEYKIPEIKSHLASALDVPNMIMTHRLEEIKEDIKKAFNNTLHSSSSTRKYKQKKMLDSEYTSCYILRKNDKSSALWFLVYTITATSSEGDFKYYYVVHYNDPHIDPDEGFTMSSWTPHTDTKEYFVKGTYTESIYDWGEGWYDEEHPEQYLGFASIDMLELYLKKNYIGTEDDDYFFYEKLAFTKNGEQNVQHIQQTLYDENKKAYIAAEFDRNEKEKPLQTIFYNKTGEVTQSIKYEYTEGGSFLKEIVTDANGNSYIAKEYIYREDGQFLKEVITGADGKSYVATQNEYNDKGWFIREIITDANGNSYVAVECEYESEDKYKQIEYDESGSITVIYYLEYYSNGMCSKYVICYPNGQEKMVATYDEDGNMLLAIYYDENGNVTDYIQ